MNNKHRNRIVRLPLQPLSRRDFLCRSCNGIGALALAGMLRTNCRQEPRTRQNLPCPTPGARPSTVFSCSWREGSATLDSFDYKPALQKLAGQELPPLSGLSGEIQGYLNKPHRVIPSAFEFKRYGQSGRAISTLFPRIGQCADDLAFVYGIEVENNNHGPATMHVTTGSQFQGSASVGSWVAYGLGKPNRNLPGYMVIQDPRGAPVNGAAVLGERLSAAAYQGTVLRSSGAPILHLDLPGGWTAPSSGGSSTCSTSSTPGTWTSGPALPSWRPGSAPTSWPTACRPRPRKRWTCRESRPTPGASTDWTMPSPRGSGASVCWPGGWWNGGSATRCWSTAWRSTSTAGTITPMWRDACGTMPPRSTCRWRACSKTSSSGGCWMRRWWSGHRKWAAPPFLNDLESKTPGRDHNQFALAMWMAGGDVKGGATAGATDEFGVKA